MGGPLGNRITEHDFKLPLGDELGVLRVLHRAAYIFENESALGLNFLKSCVLWYMIWIGSLICFIG